MQRVYPFRVTICISALCENRRKIIFVSDTKFSFGGSTSADDIATKAIEIHTRWSILFAGDDVTSVPFVVAQSRAALDKIPYPTPDEASMAVNDSLRARLCQEIEAQVLGRFGYTLESFRQNGKQDLTEMAYSDLVERIIAVKLPIQFIVAGFDRDGMGHLFAVEGDYAPADHTPVGFCAIGSGYTSAVSAMAFNAGKLLIGTYSMENEMIYGTCAAKFMAESASDVGLTTFLVIMEGGKDPRFISSPRIDEIRKIWEKNGAPRIPKKAVAAIPDMTFSVADLVDLNLVASEHKAFERIFGRTSDSSRERMTKEYRALVRATGYRKKLLSPAAAPDSPHPTDGPSHQPPSPESSEESGES
jgi:hypothetical protein